MNRDLMKLLAFPIMLLTVACNGDDRTADTFGTTDTLATTPGTGTATGAPAMGAPGTGTGMASTITLQPVAGSGVSGEATLTEMGQQTQVMVRLMGSQPNATHQGHIHSGTCDNIGSVVAPLQPVQVDGQGSGTSTSTVNVSIHDASDGRHVVAYHEAGGSPGAPAVCGEIPAHTM
jgi:hypothetical protein